MKPILLCLIALVELASCRAQTTARGVTVEDVVKLSAAGLSEDIIIQQVKKKGHAFDLSADQLIALKNAHVSDRVMQFMLDPSQPEAVAAAPVPAAAVVAPAPEPAGVVQQATPARAETPNEIGVYARKDGRWVEVPPELAYWKTGGVLKMIATAGVVRGDVNGHVPNLSSRTVLSPPLEFLIVAPDGVALTEYQLIRLRLNKDSREFRTVTGGLLHSQGGAIRDLISFNGEKLASRVYQVSFPGSAGPGEYGFLPPGSTTGASKIYSFRLMQ